MPSLSRRTLLASSVIPVGALVVPTSASAAAPSLSGLSKALGGRLAVPGQALYSSQKLLFSPQFDARKPLAVARVVNSGDVATVLRFARDNGLRVTARSGGHSYVGASAASGALVIDTCSMAAMTYDAATGRASIQPGARLYDVHKALAAHGRTIPTGTCPTVGVSGLTSGGGIGPSSREHGLTSDALVEAEVVLPDGRKVVTDRTRNPELLWALQGGGGGLVGVVTRWTFATHAATSHGTFILDLPSSAFTAILRGWAAWSTSAPTSQWGSLHLTRTSSGIAVRIVGVTRAGDERAAAAAFLRACGVKASSARYGERSHMGTVEFLGGGTTSARAPFTAGSDILTAMTPDAIRLLKQALLASPAGSAALLDPLTGAVQRVGATQTAFPWRKHLASVQWYTGRSTDAARAWVLQSRKIVSPVSAGRYINYVEPKTRLSDYLGVNAARAARLRATYDPRGALVTSLG